MSCNGMNNNSPQPHASWQTGASQYSDSGVPPPSFPPSSVSDTIVSGGAALYSNVTMHSALYLNQPMPSAAPQRGPDMHSPAAPQNQGFPTNQQQQFAQHSVAVMNLGSGGGGVPQFQDEGFAQAATSMDFEYHPELGETENPHYFHINHLLFNAHWHRLRREDGDPGYSSSFS